jgi:TolA-binding protein
MKSISRLLAAAAISALAYPVSATPLLSAFSQQAPVPPASIDAPETHRAPVILAQSGDPVFRIGQLEEQVRGLNGRIEELGFQLLQMQEQMRQMQQDNEFRFQELEKTGNQRGDAGPAVTQPGIEQSSTASTTPDTQTPGAPATDLGTIRFNDQGDLIGGIIEPADGGSETASLSSPEDMYQAGYNHMLAGDYALAEQVFADYLASNPEAPGPRMQCSGWARRSIRKAVTRIRPRRFWTRTSSFPAPTRAPTPCSSWACRWPSSTIAKPPVRHCARC